MKRIYQFAANLLSYIPAKYYWNRSTSDLVIAKSWRVNVFLKHSVTHRRPPGIQTLSSARRCGWSGQIASFFLFFGFFAKAAGRTVRPIWTNEGSKRVVPLKEVPFLGLNDVPLNFGGKSPKNWNFGAVNRTFKPEPEKIQILITWELPSRSWQDFYRRYAPLKRLRGWSNGSRKQIQDGGGHHFNLRKISITPDWIKISAPNFMGRCITAMQSRNRKLIPVTSSNERLKHKWVDLSYPVL